MKNIKTRFLLAAFLAACTSGGGPGGPDPGIDPPLITPATPLGAFAADGQMLVYPVRAALAAERLVLVSDYAAGSVVGLRDGVPVLSVKNLERPLGVAVSGNLLYVGCEGRKTVEVYDLAERRPVIAAAGFGKPNAIAVSPDRLLIYVVDSKAGVVRVLNPDLTLARTLGAPGSADGQLLNPVSVAVDATRVAVADQGNRRVVFFDPAGAFVKNVGGEMTATEVRGRFTTISSVAFSGEDLYVLDAAHALVQVFDAAGAPKGLLGQAGECDACVKLALDIAVGADGVVLATDPEHRRVVALSTEMR